MTPMKNKKEFLTELYSLLDRYDVEINLNLDGDTHGLQSWLTIDHRIAVRSWKTEEWLKADSIGKYELKEELEKQD